MASDPPLPSAAKKNIETIVELERQLLRKQSSLERLGRAVAGFFGSVRFILAHAFLLLDWFLLNTGVIHCFHPFDPYPFPFLSLIVGIEFILLTTFVLMNQKYEMRRAEQWAHLHIQLSMLTEQEVTKNMQMLSMICHKMEIQTPTQDAELRELIQPTSVTAFVGHLARSDDDSPALPPIEEARKLEAKLAREPLAEPGPA